MDSNKAILFSLPLITCGATRWWYRRIIILLISCWHNDNNQKPLFLCQMYLKRFRSDMRMEWSRQTRKFYSNRLILCWISFPSELILYSFWSGLSSSFILREALSFVWVETSLFKWQLKGWKRARKKVNVKNIKATARHHLNVWQSIIISFKWEVCVLLL